MSSDKPLFSRDELLGGLPARRASTVLFAIEARTAHLVARSRKAMAVHETDRTSAERERAFLDALAGARELPLLPTIQDLERFAPKWVDVAPREPDLRAAIARLLGRKYQFMKQNTKRLRKALGLDEPDVQAAYERLHGEPLESIYASELPLRERFRWMRSKVGRTLEELPPFWTAYTLAFTETVGAGILALPIALAGIGPIPGIAFLVIAGILNILTIGGLVEAITRNGSMRYGSTYFGRLASSLLGRGGSSTITLTLLVFNVVTFLTYLIAFAAPLARTSNLDPAIWVAVLFVINLIFLRRDLGATVASALVIGVVNIALILVISAIALGNVESEHLSFARVPFFGDNPAGTATLGLAFGVVIMAYFGHTSSGLVAKLVLEREPTGKALLRGSMAATATVIVVYSLAVVAINGALDPSVLQGHEGTALEPLAERAGPAITVLGLIYVVLAVGLVSIYVSLGMANQVREWLPTKARGTGFRRRFSTFASGQWGSYVLSALPAFVVFVLVEWLFLIDRASFTGPLSVVGTLAIPLLGGVFPMMLLAAARRRGDRVPDSWLRVLPGPIAIAIVGAVFVVGLMAQGFLVWRDPAEWLATGAVMIVIVGVVWAAIRRGAFRPQAVIELRSDSSGKESFAFVVNGQPQAVTARFQTRDGEHSLRGAEGSVDAINSVNGAAFELPATAARELRVWVHTVTPEGDSHPRPATVRVTSASGEEHEVESPNGTVTLSLVEEPTNVRILAR